MKKILFTLAAAAMVLGAASCQKENLGQIKEVKTVDNPLNTITVVCGDDTRLAIDETLTPVFEVDDVIFGWDKEGTTYAYTCTAVAQGVATFTRTSSGAPSADEGTKVNLVYAPGYEIEDIVDKTLDVNLAIQGETLPVVMHCGAEVNAQGICQAVFNNDVAIVDIKDAVLPGAAEGEEYTVAFHGKNTSLKFNLNESGVINYQADVEGPISSSIKAKASAVSKVSKRFAVPASLEATDVKITATAADGSTYTFSAGNKEIVAGKYITVTGKEFAPQYVAQIGSDKYMTLAKAVAAANEAENAVTIDILNDCTLKEDFTFITNTKGVTLDLAGNTITGNLTVSSSSEDTFTGGKLIVKDTKGNGKISATKCAILVQAKGSFELQSGELSSKPLSGSSYHTLAGIVETEVEPAPADRPYILVSGGKVTGSSQYGSLLVKYSDAIITNGEICASERDYNTRALYTQIGGKITIEDGKFSANQCYHSGSGKDGASITIKGGTFSHWSREDSRILNLSNSNTGTIVTGGYFNGTFANVGSGCDLSVSGGYYTEEISASFLAEGFVCAPESTTGPDGKTYNYTVKEGILNIASVTVGETTTNYSSIDDVISAVNASESDVTVKMLNDYDLDKTFGITNTKGAVTLNLAGKKISLKGGIADCINIGEGVNFKLEDSVGGGIIDQTTGGTEADGFCSAIVSSGNFTMTGGTITVTGGAANASYNYTVLLKKGTMHMTGGTINAKRCGIRMEGDSEATIEGNSSINISTTSTSTTLTNGIGIWMKDKSHLNVKADELGNAPHIETNRYAPVFFHSADCSANIDAGYYSMTQDKNILGANTSSWASAYHVKGGYYSKKVSNTAMSSEPEYECVENTDPATNEKYPYVVVKK